MMDAKGVLRQVVEFGDMLAHAYVDDLSEADLLVRAVPGSNHIAWQLGHMIAGTAQMLGELGHKAPALPEGFLASYGKETASSDDPKKFSTKATYLALMQEMKAASLAAIDATPESALDQPGPESMREYAPTVASGLCMLGGHVLMHVGQFVPIRRKLGKAPLF